MNKIDETFGKSRVLLPVVHCVDAAQAHRAVDLAVECGADGVFLIDQGGMTWEDVLDVVHYVNRTTWVGVNMLRLRHTVGIDSVRGAGAGGYWSDDAGVRVANGVIDARQAMSYRDHRMRITMGGTDVVVYFGGVAFKYRAAVDPALHGQVARAAADMGVDVVTTSGDATGHPPTVEKIAAMREAIGDHALAIASGITPANVDAFLPYANAFLVATGIEKDFGVFDAGKIRALADAIHGAS